MFAAILSEAKKCLCRWRPKMSRAETDKPIIEVAYESGFSQLTFFYRFFRHEMGSNPKAFRASQQAKDAKKLAR